MNAPLSAATLTAPATLMSGANYRDSLRRLRPTVYVDGRRVESVADEPSLAPGANALAYTYDFARDPKLAPVALATQVSRGKVVNRMLHVNESAGDCSTSSRPCACCARRPAARSATWPTTR